MKLENINKTSIVLFIYLLGLFHWLFLINYGNSQFNYFDWPVTKNFYLLIKKAIEEQKIPYFVSLFDKNYFNNKFFANGLYSISPQIYLIKFLKIKNFINFNILFFYSIGFYFSFLISKQLKFNNFQTILFLILINFNGYITSKISVGHLGSSNAIFLIPAFFYLIFRIHHSKNFKERFNSCIYFSLFIFFCKLNSNAHQIEQFLIVGLIYFIFFYEKILDYVISLIIIFFLIFYYIYPTFLFNNFSNREIFAGYMSPLEIFFSLTQINNAGHDGQWEKNIYIGYTAFIFLIISFYLNVLIRFNKVIKNNNELKLFTINIILFLFSIYLIKSFLYNLFDTIFFLIPKVDRLPTRMIIYPLYFFICYSIFYLKNIPFLKNNKIKISIVVLILFELTINSFQWSLFITDKYYHSYPEVYYPQIEPKIINGNLGIEDNINYLLSLKFSFLISIIAFTLCIIFLVVNNIKKIKTIFIICLKKLN